MSSFLCHPNSISSSFSKGLDANKFQKYVIDGTVQLCREALNESNEELQKSQKSTFKNNLGFKFTTEIVKLSTLIEKEYFKAGNSTINSTHKYFSYFAAASLEGRKIVIKFPSALVNIDFASLSMITGVEILQPMQFVDALARMP